MLITVMVMHTLSQEADVSLRDAFIELEETESQSRAGKRSRETSENLLAIASSSTAPRSRL